MHAKLDHALNSDDPFSGVRFVAGIFEVVFCCPQSRIKGHIKLFSRSIVISLEILLDVIKRSRDAFDGATQKSEFGFSPKFLV